MTSLASSVLASARASSGTCGSEEGEEGEEEGLAASILTGRTASSEQQPLLKASGSGSFSKSEESSVKSAKGFKKEPPAGLLDQLRGSLTNFCKPFHQRLSVARFLWPLVGALLLLGIVSAVQLFRCHLSDWGPWEACAPIGARCGQGVSRRGRGASGRCESAALEESRDCDLGECSLRDYLATADPLPCSRRFRERLLIEAKAAYGDEVWERLEDCSSTYLCCHQCNDVYGGDAPLDCEDVHVTPRPLFAFGQCLSCFAATATPSGNVGCDDALAVCRRHPSSILEGIRIDVEMCCILVGPQQGSIGEHAANKVHREAPLDTENFKRWPSTSAVIGTLQVFNDWSRVANEAECQLDCWEDVSCYLYTYFTWEHHSQDWRGRCVMWDVTTANREGRADASSWIEQPHVNSGLQLPMSYSNIIITVRTSTAPGSDSKGPFTLFICSDQNNCQDRSPQTLTATSCEAKRDCLDRGKTSHFFGRVVVLQDFQLRFARVESHTQDNWVIEKIMVNCEGQVGMHDSRVSLSSANPWYFELGCVTTTGPGTTAPVGSRCQSECMDGFGEFGWCWVDELTMLWGDCAEQCKQSRKAGTFSMVMSSLSCAELNWPTWSRYNNDPSSCGVSNDRPLRGCSGQLAWEMARDICESVGARLCTRAELEADTTAGTGCDLDMSHVWSSTPCRPGAYMAIVGASQYVAEAMPKCILQEEKSASVRCCADTRKVVVTFRREHRNAHSLPEKLQAGGSGNLVSWQVVSGTNYLGKPGYFLQSGMLSNQAPLDLEYLDVVLLDVPVAESGGEIQFYFRIDSEPHTDRLRFYIDDVEVTSSGFPQSGRIDWVLARFAFPSEENGELHSFRWRYVKDGSNSIGRDVACIDNIVVLGVLSSA